MSELIAELDVESVRISRVKTEWEIEMIKEDGENIYEYVEYPDHLYEQLVECGELEPGEINE